MNHYYLSSQNVAILNIVIKHVAKSNHHQNDDLENSKEYTIIMNYVHQVTYLTILIVWLIFKILF
jgi:hypothetical protein